jgi:hypothetical protein
MKSPQAGQSRNLAHTADPNRDLARLALTHVGDWDSPYLARKHGLAETRRTREALEVERAQKLSQMEPKLDGSLTAIVKSHLSTIGCAVRPDFTPQQATDWINALTIKLADLPPSVAAKATGRALHIPFQFPSDVEAKVRELADEHMDRLATAIARLKAVEKAITDAINPDRPKQIESPVKPGEKVLSDREVHELQRGGDMTKMVLRLGMTLGYITPDQLLPLNGGDTQKEEPINEF